MSILLEVFRKPHAARDFSPKSWDRLLRETHAEGLAARLSWIFEAHALQDQCPAMVWEDLAAQRRFDEYNRSQVRLELRKLHKALTPVGIPIMLLKGAAYVDAGLEVAQGRDFADLDILVPRSRLEAAETALEAGGWLSETKNRYDQRYYRRWMHELPPVHHRTRTLEVDIHHALLPLTGRVRPDPELIWAAAWHSRDSRFLVPCPEDLLLHCAAQLFQDGEIAGQFKNLLDLCQLIDELAAQAGFWDRLLARARLLQLGRPLHYALRYSHSLLGTDIPQHVLDSARAHGPGGFVQWLMDLLVARSLIPVGYGLRPATLAVWLLYLRSHWLRMPPTLLAAHLMRKAFRYRDG